MPFKPSWLEEAGVMAKSQQKGGESLPEHTWQVLSRLADQYRLRPTLPQLTDHSLLWEQMYWAAFLHDFGKAAEGFQAMLRAASAPSAPPVSQAADAWRERRHRHEVLSLAFVEWLFPRGHSARPWVLGTIVTHHRDAEDILSKYGGRFSARELPEDEREDLAMLRGELAAQISPEVRKWLWRWLAECALPWAAELGFPVQELPLCSWEEAEQTDLARALYRALRDFATWQKQLEGRDAHTAILMRGLIFTADHAASAGAEAFPPMPLSDEVAERPLRRWTLYDHQRQARRAPSTSAIMVAPTGSGKTEAALLWAARQMQYRPAARLFYTLPYQASMNAMAERLAERYFGVRLSDEVGNRAVTVQHSRALQKFYQDMMAYDDLPPRERGKKARWLHNLAKLGFYPIQVSSPYQMLKAAYNLKGYEALLLDYADALFIFDEIHAYDPRRMALIVTMINWLAENLRARFLVMTATLPPTVRKALDEALPGHAEIVASPEVFERSQRHVVHVLEGALLDNLGRVVEDVESGKSVLVICNRVAHAQYAFRALKARLGLSDDHIVLLHGRFNGEDRRRKERQLLKAVGVRREQKRPFVVVATQVVEVSLDIDLDTLYSDPAPLEALLQRFGRVNRGRAKRALLPVHVFREPSTLADAEPSYLPYDEIMVRESVRVLEAECQGLPVDEGRVTEMLEQIYAHPQIWDAWWQAYQESAQEFKEVILEKIHPYQSAGPDTMHRFYELFDGVQVLPADCQDAYYDALENEGYLAASRYLVNISWRQYGELKGYGMIRREKDEVPVTTVHYDPDFGLDIDGARRMARGG